MHVVVVLVVVWSRGSSSSLCHDNLLIMGKVNLDDWRNVDAVKRVIMYVMEEKMRRCDVVKHATSSNARNKLPRVHGPLLSLIQHAHTEAVTCCLLRNLSSPCPT